LNWRRSGPSENTNLPKKRPIIYIHDFSDLRFPKMTIKFLETWVNLNLNPAKIY